MAWNWKIPGWPEFRYDTATLAPLEQRFLLSAGEILGAMLMTEHNIWFYEALMADLRAAIAAGELTSFANGFRAAYQRGKGE